MLGISLEDVDEIYTLVLNLEILTYLQGLVQCDTEEGNPYPCALSYLWEQQRETVALLRKLLHREGFASPL